jgi:glutaredoxin 2
MESNSTIVQMNNDEKNYYVKVDEYINSLDEKFREKCIIKQQVYDDILKCLLLRKGSPSDAYSSTVVYWVKHKFILIKIAGIFFYIYFYCPYCMRLTKIAGIDIVACIKSKTNLCL